MIVISLVGAAYTSLHCITRLPESKNIYFVRLFCHCNDVYIHHQALYCLFRTYYSRIQGITPTIVKERTKAGESTCNHMKISNEKPLPATTMMKCVTNSDKKTGSLIFLQTLAVIECWHFCCQNNELNIEVERQVVLRCLCIEAVEPGSDNILAHEKQLNSSCHCRNCDQER